MSPIEELENWKKKPRTKVETVDTQNEKRLMEAIENGEVIKIWYDGGSNPGTVREIQPKELFRVSGYESSMYLNAFCYLRKEPRSFRLDKIRFSETIKLKPRKSQNTERKARDPGRPPTRVDTGNIGWVGVSVKDTKAQIQTPEVKKSEPAIQSKQLNSTTSNSSSSGVYILILIAVAVVIFLILK